MAQFGYAEGVGLGMALADASSARSRANNAERDLHQETQRRRALEIENAELKRQLAQYQKAYGQEYFNAIHNLRMASSGYIVMTGMIKALDNLNPIDADKFRREVIEYANGRFDTLDKEYIEEAEKNGVNPQTIRGIFSQQPEYKKIGFDR